jgi:spermidine/putrescine transport system permease protein
MNQKKLAWVLVGAPAACLLLFFVLPMIGMVVFSFRSDTFGAEREVFTLANYQAYFQHISYQLLLLRSIWIALVVSLLSVVLSYPVAYFLAYQAGPRRLSWLTILLAPAWTSYLLRILAWKLILSSGGMLNAVLLGLGLIQEAQPILLYTQAAVVITLIYAWIPFVAMPIFAALDRIDGSLLEAAADLGSPPWRSFLRVTLPLSLPGALAGFFIVFIPTLGEWVTPLLVGGVRGTMYGNAIQDEFVRALNWPLGSVMSLVLLALVLLLLFVFSRKGRLADLAGV